MLAGWSALLQLTALTELWAGGNEITDGALQELAALTRLKSLTLLPCASITAVGLLQLTQLTDLTYLRVNYDISAEGWDGGALDAVKHDGGLVMWGAVSSASPQTISWGVE